jgi:hypothetical protein
MSLQSKKKNAARTKMFPLGTKMVWAATDAEAKKIFDSLMKLREEYRKAGGIFKKK